jgi:cytochrome c peroxidase
MAQRDEPITPVPLNSNIDLRRAALGERLFHDSRLSHDQKYSCATCHPLDHGGMDGLPVAKSPVGGPDLRNTLTVFNAGLNASYNWDGITNSLEDHTDRVLRNPELMNMSGAELLSRIRGDAGYTAAFQSAYPQALTHTAVLDAIASFERSLLTPNSRFDRFLRGDVSALSGEERRGYRLFKAYGCVSCHQGVNVGGNLYQKFGVFEDRIPGERSPRDLGRFRITKVPRDRHVFRVPSLRNVAVTAPYFHDGREPDLKGAVKTMAKAQLGRRLSEDEIADVVAFLKTLTGKYRGKILAGPPSGEPRR